jgi:formylglycine-generating enzyme required for sulfatase activity
VGSFRANGFGLHDVHGNVWEWVEDCWHGNYEGAPVDGSVWVSGGYCEDRVLRGGSWFIKPSFLRSANRFRNSPGDRLNNFGFRIARTLTP